MPTIAQLENLLAKEPDDVFLNFGLAMALAKEMRFDEACARFDRALSFDAGYIPAWFQKGRTLSDAGRFPEARQALASGIAKAKETGDFHAVAEMEELLTRLHEGG